MGGEQVRLKPTAALAFVREAQRLGRDAGPQLMVEWLENGRLPQADLWRVIGNVWMMAEWPQRSLGAERWVELWRSVGFVSDTGEEAPTEPIRAFRGASWGRRRGMSWSLDRERAEWFAARPLIGDFRDAPQVALSRQGDGHSIPARHTGTARRTEPGGCHIVRR